MEYSVMRKKLESEGLDDEIVNYLIREVNELELQSLQGRSSTNEIRVALIIGAVLVLGGAFLWFWIRSTTLATAWQLLALVPILGAFGLYLIAKGNADKRDRLGAHTRFQ